jgi:hypothetical protein
VEAHAAAGIKISMNQAALILIRRGATPEPDTEEEARAQIERHWAACTLGCDVTKIKCAEGWRLRDAFQQLREARPVALAPAPAPAPGPARAFPPFPINRTRKVQP